MINGWYNKDKLPTEMVKGAKAELEGWVKLEYTDHFKILDNIIKSIDISSILDIGCGAGEISRLYSNLDYCGCDLPHIIDNVSMKVNPQSTYIKFDANEINDFSFIEKYDLILMNSFLSEISSPLEFIKKIIKFNVKYILIHRQNFTKKYPTSLEEYFTYGGIKTTNSIINYDEFLSLVKNRFNVDIKQNCGYHNKYTILLKKKINHD